MGENGRQMIERFFTEEEMINNFMNILNSLSQSKEINT
jgi:hypothetical protein